MTATFWRPNALRSLAGVPIILSTLRTKRRSLALDTKRHIGQAAMFRLAGKPRVPQRHCEGKKMKKAARAVKRGGGWPVRSLFTTRKITEFPAFLPNHRAPCNPPLRLLRRGDEFSGLLTPAFSCSSYKGGEAREIGLRRRPTVTQRGSLNEKKEK